MTGLPQATILGGSSGFPWPPSPQAPYTLPPYQGDRTLPFTPPDGPTLNYLRMNMWGVVVPGLPWVPGITSSKYPERCLTAYVYVPEWKDWLDRILDAHVARGYNVFGLWLADMVAQGGLSPDAVLALCQKIRARGFNIRLWLGSKNWPQFIPPDSTAATWKRILDPYLDRLLANGCLQMAVLGGEFNLWNVPGQLTYDIATYGVNKCTSFGCLVDFHMSTWVTWWGAGRAQAEAASLKAIVDDPTPYVGSDDFAVHDRIFRHTDVHGTTGEVLSVGHYAGDGDRFAWTKEMCDLGVAGLGFQLDSDADIPLMQARICDTLGRVDPRFQFRCEEVSASREFDDSHPTEVEAAARGFGCLCTRPLAGSPHSDVHVMGLGDGGWQPSGAHC